MENTEQVENKKMVYRKKQGVKKEKEEKTISDLKPPSRHQKSVECKIPSKHEEKSLKEPIIEDKPIENAELELQKILNKTEDVVPKPNELIDFIEFSNGKDTLTIKFSKKHNRMFRIQVFLNDKTEIRPVTYTGSSTGYAFWNLLKGAMKK